MPASVARKPAQWEVHVPVSVIALATLIGLLAMPGMAQAQWEIQDSHTTASLRGIHSVDGTVAWASGRNGTVLRTVDGGKLWQACAVPTGGGALDFRGVQAFDANSAIVLSSGKGDLSRLYETTDGCRTWKLLLTNPDPGGFWNAVRAADLSTILVLGDPVAGAFQIRRTTDGGENWTVEQTQPGWTDETASAASNSALSVNWADGPTIFGTSSLGGARLFREDCFPCRKQTEKWAATQIDAFAWNPFAGISSIHQSTWDHFVAVGGDYEEPALAERNAAWSNDGGRRWHLAQTLPHGYRSAVDYDAVSRAWITVGPNGTDISIDDGRNWQPLKPGTGDPPDADQKWNALSLPFVVGPNGRIGKLKNADKL